MIYGAEKGRGAWFQIRGALLGVTADAQCLAGEIAH